MADKIPQFEDSQPIISPTKVNSSASGYDAMARTLGAISQKAGETAEGIAADESQSMYVNSVANAEQVKTKAQELMLEHPDMTQKIASSAQTQLDSIKTGAYVNQGDRNKLTSYLSETNDDIQLKAVENQVKQGQLGAALTHYENFPDFMKAYSNAAATNHDQAETLRTSMLNNLRNLVATGALTPEQAGTEVKAMSAVTDGASRLHQWTGDSDMTAQDYHTANASPLNDNKSDPGAPIEGNTKWLVDYYSGDKSMQGVLADINKRMMPSPEAIMSLTPAQNAQALETMHGAMVADGLINSAQPFPAIEKAYQQLNERGRTLSYQEQGTRNALGTYIKDLKNGDYLSVMSETPAGNAVMERFNQRNAAIQNLSVSDDRKSQLMMQNQNSMVNDSVAYGQAHHIPAEYIQPIPASDVAIVKNAFNLGSDPATLLTTLGKYSKQNQAYVAQAMKDPKQAMVVQAVSLANNTSNQDKVDFIAANQTGRVYLNKDFKGAIHDNTLMNQIAANLSPQMRLLQANHDTQDAPTLQNAMLDNTLNYSKFLAQKNNDMTMANWKDYVSKASTIYNDAYQQRSGTNWIVNDSQLPANLSDGQLDTLAAYAVDEGNNYLKNGRSDSEYQQQNSKNPLKMIITGSGDVQAVDGSGRVAFTSPFSTNMMALAEKRKKERDLERQKQVKENMHSLMNPES